MSYKNTSGRGMAPGTQRRGLGRGLGSLIPTAPRPAAPQTDDGRPRTSPADFVGQRSGTGGVAGAGELSPPASAQSIESIDGVSPGGVSTEGTSGGETLNAGSVAAADGLAPVEGAYFADLPVDAITPNPRQPRQAFDEDAMAELVHSVREVGLLQPIVVRPAASGRFELIMGERRWRASRDAGLETIPAVVRETEDDALLRDALLENLHRAELNPLEEAAAYQSLLEDFGCTHEELAARLGRSRPQISNTLRLLRLPPGVQRRVASGVLSAGHARALLAVENPDIANRLAARVVAEGISVRSLEEIVSVGEDGAGREARAGHRSKPTAPGLADLATRLSDRLETRVKVDLGRRKGKITVEFASIPDLERIVGLIDPGSDPARDAAPEDVAQV